MTDRREFLGAVAAVFCGTLLPEPVRESIVWHPVTWGHHNEFLMLLDEVPTSEAIKTFYNRMIDAIWVHKEGVLVLGNPSAPRPSAPHYFEVNLGAHAHKP